MLGYAMSHSQIETWALFGEFYITILPEDRNDIAVFLSFSSAFGFKARRRLKSMRYYRALPGKSPPGSIKSY